MSGVLHCDLVIIGGGPAGLAAAAQAATLGVQVVIIEENAQLGGKLRGQLHEEVSGHWWVGWDEAELLVRTVEGLGVTALTETVAWSIDVGYRVRVSSSRGGDGAIREVQAKSVLVATGAVERPLPVEGWTLPGVMTIGGAQILTNVHRIRPGRRALVVGVDPLSITIGRAMQLGKVDVQAFVLPPEGTPGSAPKQTLKRLSSLSKLAPYFYMRVGGRLLATAWIAAVAARLIPRSLPLWGIPLQLNTRLVRIIGDGAVRAVEVERVRPDGKAVPGSRRILEVDSVCLSNGLDPLNDLLNPIDVEFLYNSSVGGRIPLHSSTGLTERRGLFVAGNSVGVEGAKVALKQGAIVAGEIAEFLGCGEYRDRDKEFAELRKIRTESEFTFQPHIQIGHDEVDAAFQGKVALVATRVPSD